MSKRVRSVTNLVPIEGFGVVAEWNRRSQRHGGNLEEVKDEQEAIQKEGEKERIEKFKLTFFFFFFFFFFALSFAPSSFIFFFFSFFKRSLRIHPTVILKWKLHLLRRPLKGRERTRWRAALSFISMANLTLSHLRQDAARTTVTESKDDEFDRTQVWRGGPFKFLFLLRHSEWKIFSSIRRGCWLART